MYNPYTPSSHPSAREEPVTSASIPDSFYWLLALHIAITVISIVLKTLQFHYFEDSFDNPVTVIGGYVFLFSILMGFVLLVLTGYNLLNGRKVGWLAIAWVLLSVVVIGKFIWSCLGLVFL